MPPNSTSSRIAEHILDFVRHEINKDRIPPNLPWQAGVGDVANAVLSGFIELCGAPHNSIYVECSFMWRTGWLGFLLRLPPVYLFTLIIASSTP
jgi:hypothetical protein